MLFLAILAYVCAGFGITRIKATASWESLFRWRRLPTAVKALIIVTEPVRTVWRGWEMMVLPLLSPAFGVDMELLPDRNAPDWARWVVATVEGSAAQRTSRRP